MLAAAVCWNSCPPHTPSLGAPGSGALPEPSLGDVCPRHALDGGGSQGHAHTLTSYQATCCGRYLHGCLPSHNCPPEHVSSVGRLRVTGLAPGHTNGRGARMEAAATRTAHLSGAPSLNVTLPRRPGLLGSQEQPLSPPRPHRLLLHPGLPSGDTKGNQPRRRQTGWEPGHRVDGAGVSRAGRAGVSSSPCWLGLALWATPSSVHASTLSSRPGFRESVDGGPTPR